MAGHAWRKPCLEARTLAKVSEWEGKEAVRVKAEGLKHNKKEEMSHPQKINGQYWASGTVILF